MGNASNLGVSVTADITDLRAKLALAQQDLKATTSAMNAAAAEARKSGASWDEQARAVSVFAEKQTAAKSAVDGIKSKLAESSAQVQGNAAVQRTAAAAVGDFTAATNQATSAVKNHGAASEAMVLVHEAMSGRFTKMSGSLMILTQRLGGASMAMMGLAGVFSVAAMGAMHLVEWLDKVHDAKLLAEAGALGTGISRDQADEAVSTLRSLSGVTTEEAGKIANAYLQMRGVTQPVIEELTRVTREFAQRTGEDNTAAAQKIASAFNLEGTAATEVMEKTRASAETTRALQDAITNSRPVEARAILLRELARSAHEVDTQTRAAADATQVLTEKQAARVAGDMMQKGGGLFPPEAIQQISKLAGAEEAEAEVNRLKAAIASLNDEMKLPAALSWSEQQRMALASATLATVEAGRQQNESWQQISQDKLITERDFWKKAVEATRAGSKEQEEARRSLYQAEEQLAATQSRNDGTWGSKVALQAKEAGDTAVTAAYTAHQARLAITEAGTKAEMAVYLAASRDMAATDAERAEAKRQYITLDMSLMKQQAGAETSAAKQAYEARVAQFDVELANAKGNAQQVMSIERQKLDYIRSIRGQASADYAKAEKGETEAVAASVTEQIRLLEQAGQRRITDHKEVLSQEAGIRQISKAEELTDLLQFTQAQRDSELQSVNDLVNSLQVGTAAYKTAIDARTKLIEDFGIRLKTLQAQLDTATTNSNNKIAEGYINTFSRIGSSAEQAFTGYLTGSMTWQRAELEVAKSVLSSFVSLGVQMVERWTVTQLAMTASSTTQTAVRKAQEASFDTTGFSALIAAWTTKETTQTGITTTAAATRASADSSGGFLSAIGSMIARWLGLETAKTAATDAGAADRATVEGTSAAAGLQITGAAARLSIATAAAVAAAWAFADSAAAGPPGLVAAPGVSAGAFATVMAYQAAVPALAVGTYNVPQDMLAQIHQGEIVVPAFQSSMIRSGQASLGAPGGGGDSSSGSDNGSSGANTTVQFNISAMDAASVQSFLRANGAQIAQIVAGQQSRNPSMRATY